MTNRVELSRDDEEVENDDTEVAVATAMAVVDENQRTLSSCPRTMSVLLEITKCVSHGAQIKESTS